MRWFHGGPHIPGDTILPPSITGAIGTSDLVDDADAVYDRTRVYITDDYQAAILFAAVHRRPWVYEVEPVGDLHPDLDFFSDAPFQSMSCASARIKRRLRPSNAAVIAARQAVIEG